MEYVKIQVKVPKDMQMFFSDDYAIETDDEAKVMRFIFLTMENPIYY